MTHRTQRSLIVATLGALLVLAAGGASAADAKAQCRDAKGHFAKCPAAATTAKHCRDMTTKKFAKCGAPNSQPVPAAGAK